MSTKHQSETFQSNDYNYTLDANQKTSYTLNFEENSSGNIFIIVKGQGKLELKLNFKKDSKWSVLFLNQNKESLEINETITLDENADLDLNYGEFAKVAQTKDTVLDLIGQHAKVDFNAAVLTDEKLSWKILAHHQAKHSYANVTTHAIVLENTEMDLDVIGKIDNGFSGSETHQTSRIMNLGDGLKTVVHPQLLIEENDVAASHAATVGQPNPEHLYYLQSRGLNSDQAMRLIVLGYLMPLIQSIQNQTIQDRLKEEVEAKVFGI